MKKRKKKCYVYEIAFGFCVYLALITCSEMANEYQFQAPKPIKTPQSNIADVIVWNILTSLCIPVFLGYPGSHQPGF